MAGHLTRTESLPGTFNLVDESISFFRFCESTVDRGQGGLSDDRGVALWESTVIPECKIDVVARIGCWFEECIGGSDVSFLGVCDRAQQCVER
jgi:hypothetical protein